MRTFRNTDFAVDDGRDGGRVPVLDPDGQPSVWAFESTSAALARVASVMNAESDRLSDDDCEQIVRWAKYLKFSNNTPVSHAYRVDKFKKNSDAIRKSDEQKVIMAKAHAFDRKRSGFWFLSTILLLAGLVVLFSPADGRIVPRWYSTILFLLALVSYWKRARYEIAAANAWKEQERIFWSRCLRAANSVDELFLAGVFSELVDADGNPVDSTHEIEFGKAMRVERERLADALYRESAYSFTGSVPRY
jgi:hypothetical protein